MLKNIRVLEAMMYDLEKRIWKVKLTINRDDTRQELDAMEEQIRAINKVIGALRKAIGE